MRYDQGGSVHQQFFKGLLYLQLCLRIDVGRCFIEQNQLGVAGKCPGDGDQLSLSTGYGRTAFGQNGIKSLG